MRQKYGKQILLFICVLMVFSLNACNLLPVEEELHQVTIQKPDHTSDYLLTMAENRDVVLSKNISCTYLQLNKPANKKSIGK